MVQKTATTKRQIAQSKPLLVGMVLIVLCIGVGAGAGVYVANYLFAQAPEPIPPSVSVPRRPSKAPVVSEPDAVIPPIVDGMVPEIQRLETKQPVAFLTIDDGGVRQPEFPQYLRQNNLKATLFLANAFIEKDPKYFRAFVRDGHVIENHTLGHDLAMSTKPIAYQQQQICGMSDQLVEYYGRRPALFRAPGGRYTDITRRAAHQCNMRAIVGWKATIDYGVMRYQEGTMLKPGDIVLLHFRDGFKTDIDVYLKETSRAGLRTELLEDWL